MEYFVRLVPASSHDEMRRRIIAEGIAEGDIPPSEADEGEIRSEVIDRLVAELEVAIFYPMLPKEHQLLIVAISQAARVLRVLLGNTQDEGLSQEYLRWRGDSA